MVPGFHLEYNLECSLTFPESFAYSAPAVPNAFGLGFPLVHNIWKGHLPVASVLDFLIPEERTVPNKDSVTGWKKMLAL